jgi:hypothetical protein
VDLVGFWVWCGYCLAVVWLSRVDLVGFWVLVRLLLGGGVADSCGFGGHVLGPVIISAVLKKGRPQQVSHIPLCMIFCLPWY